MLYYERIEISKGTDLAKTGGNKECMVCHYWFCNYGFKYHDSVCNGCHALSHKKWKDSLETRADC